MKPLSRLMYLVTALMVLLGCLDTVSAQTNSFVVGPTSLTFTSIPGQSPAPQNLTLGTSGAAVAFSVQSSANLPGCSAITLGGYTPITPTTVPVFVQAASLPSGVYNCTLTFTTTANGGFQATVPVTITVGSGGGTSGQLTASPTTLTLSAQTGSSPASATVTLTNANPSIPVSYTAAVSSTPTGWLQISPTTGTAPPNNTIQVQANPLGLAAGQTYQGSITITPSGSTAITIPVSFTVSGNPTLQIQQGTTNVTAVNFAYQTGTALPAAQVVNLSSSNAGTNLQCTVSTSGNSSFLVVNPTGTVVTPQNVVVSIASSSANLPAGSYTANLNVNCPGAANPTTSIPVNFLVSSTPLLTVVGAMPSAFTFTTGGTNPPNQTVQIGSTSTALPFTVTTSVPSGQNWLSVGPLSGNASLATPATLTISVNPATLLPGTYNGSVVVTSPTAGNSPLTIPVTLTVSNSTLLGANPSAVTFSYQTTGSLPTPQNVTITSSGTPLDFNVTANTATCGNFLTVSQVSGNTGAVGATFQVSVNPSGITTSQVCSGTISISSPGAPNTVNIPVMLEVSTNPLIQVSTSALNFSGQIGSGLTGAQTLTLTSTDNATALQFAVFNPVPWLRLGQTTGTTPANIQIQADTSALGLQVGTNTTTLQVTSPSLPGPINIPVTVTLTSSATVSANPVSLTFAQAAGGPAPAAQTVTLAIAGGTAAGMTFTAVASSNFGNFLSVTPSSGVLPANNQLTVSVNGATLSQGTYTGNVIVTVTGASNSPLQIPVTLTVGPPQSISVAPGTLTFTSGFGASTNPATQTLQLASTGGPVNFTATTSTTSCGQFLTATPSTGTTPATLTVGVNVANLPAGTCSGSITISGNGVQSQTVNVTLNITAAAAPQITTIVNGASFSPGAIAPGEIVTIFGSNIGPTTLTTGTPVNNVFPTTVSNTQVLFDGLPAPIIFVRNDQLSVVVPFDIAGRLQTNIQVVRGGQNSNILQQRVVDTAPGIFTIPSGGTGQGAIVNQVGTINSSGAPAPRGSVAAIYITGAGALTPLGPNGSLGTTNPLQTIDLRNVSVTIDGQNATVLYAGAAPGNILGLYQINVLVPQTASTGSVIVTVGGNPSQAGVTMAVQ
jgi:uncharacterized protein (TIGR03437 family)